MLPSKFLTVKSQETGSKFVFKSPDTNKNYVMKKQKLLLNSKQILSKSTKEAVRQLTPEKSPSNRETNENREISTKISNSTKF